MSRATRPKPRRGSKRWHRNLRGRSPPMPTLRTFRSSSRSTTRPPSPWHASMRCCATAAAIASKCWWATTALRMRRRSRLPNPCPAFATCATRRTSVSFAIATPRPRMRAGRYLVFLNNDTLVLAGLAGRVDRHAGSARRHRPRGLQAHLSGRSAAGMRRDRLARRIGMELRAPRGSAPARSSATGATSTTCRAHRSRLRSELWATLGGFDEAFVPAYAEDADLAFRVRSRGLRTVVQPLSQLLHFEGISSGTDLGAGAKAYQVENLRKLHARWAAELDTHRDNAVAARTGKGAFDRAARAVHRPLHAVAQRGRRIAGRVRGDAGVHRQRLQGHVRAGGQLRARRRAYARPAAHRNRGHLPSGLFEHVGVPGRAQGSVRRDLPAPLRRGGRPPGGVAARISRCADRVPQCRPALPA